MPFDFPTTRTTAVQRRRRALGLVNHLKGMAAEESVIAAYCAQGNQVLARRWRGQAGEIDLIFSDNGTVVFVEVKASRDHARASTHLSARQVGVISRAIDEYLGDLPMGGLTEIRFDLAMVDGQGQVDILANVLAG